MDQPRVSDVARQFAVVFAAIFQIYASFIVGASVGTIAQEVRSLIIPATYAFAIWGPIFILCAVYMELAEQGLDDTGVGVAVEVEREEAVSRFRYTLILPPQLEGHRSALLARLERSPVRTTLSKTLEFAPGGTE